MWAINIWQAICNHCAVAIQSVPNFKVFTFCGQYMTKVDRSEWRYTNEISMLDTGAMQWIPCMNVEGDIPDAREDAAWFFDRWRSRLVVFGGWADHWFDDVFALDVSGIVGPPYACSGLEPTLGPYTGKTPLRIFGMQFRETDDVQVQFSGAFGSDTVRGKWVSATELSCLTPPFEKYGAGEVDVKIALGGMGYTVNRIKFAYFQNTRAPKCIAFGPGVFDQSVWGVANSFIIQPSLYSCGLHSYGPYT